MKNIIIASTSTIHGSGYLEYLMEPLNKLFSKTEEILFIPYARPSGITHDDYTKIASDAFKKFNKKIIGLHTFKDPIAALNKTQAIFTGGGNTFLLVRELHRHNLITPLKNVILSGTPYLGTSAGSNICGLTMQTTNDMPIVHTPSHKTLGVVPFNINPHYLDPDPKSTHKGETRETRIKEYHQFNTPPVVGLREGSWLRISDNEIYLRGGLHARIFEQGKSPYEIESGNSLSNLN